MSEADQEYPVPVPAGPLDWMEDYELSDAEAEKLADPEWVYEGLIPEGHIVVFAAPPNGGKTTVLFHLACTHIVDRGYDVVYVHADVNPSGAKAMRAEAVRANVRYLTPDMKVGKSMEDIVRHLDQLSNSDVDLTGQVWFFDTLKKMGDVIQKTGMKKLFQMFRRLCAKGMTVCLLAHTNKWKDSDGNWKFEGVGDLESDCDDLIYFDPDKGPDGSLVVSTVCEVGRGKRRADIEPMTFEISADRKVARSREYVDVAQKQARAAQRETDEPIIAALTEVLTSEGTMKQYELIAFAKAASSTFNEKRTRAVLRRYSGDLWRADKLGMKNAWEYSLYPSPCRTEKLPN